MSNPIGLPQDGQASATVHVADGSYTWRYATRAEFLEAVRLDSLDDRTCDCCRQVLPTVSDLVERGDLLVCSVCEPDFTMVPVSNKSDGSVTDNKSAVSDVCCARCDNPFWSVEGGLRRVNSENVCFECVPADLDEASA